MDRGMTVDPEALAEWTLAGVRARHEYARHRAAVDDLAIEYPCAKCRQGEHRECRGNSGPARRHRCLCWEMWHPGHDDNTKETA